VEQRISLITLGVSDLGRARSFYEALGWAGAQQPDDEVLLLPGLGGIGVRLWTALGGHGAPGVELAHNVRSPEEVGQVLQEAERAGGSIVRPAALAEWAEHQAPSPTRTAMYGRSPTMRGGLSPTTARSGI